MYKLEIISLLVNMQNISHVEAWDTWEAGTINFDPFLFKIMEYMVNEKGVICEINRNRQMLGFAA